MSDDNERKVRRPRDPRNPARRLCITGTKAEVDGILRELRRQALDVRLGLASGEQVRARVEALAGGPLTVADVWGRHTPTLSVTWQRQAASIWKCRLAPHFTGRAAVELTSTEMALWEEAELLRGRACEKCGAASLQACAAACTGQLERGVTKTTVNIAFAVLAAAYRRQVREGALQRVPWGAWKPKGAGRRTRREACRSTDELAMLCAAARARDILVYRKFGYADLYYRVLILALCSLRQAEGAAAAWDWVRNLHGEDPELGGPGGRVTFQVRAQARDGWRSRVPYRPAELPKGRERAGEPDPPIVLHPSAVRALRQQEENVRRRGWYRPDGPIFPRRPDGDFRSHADLIHPEREFRAIWKAAGLPNPERATPHSLRHTGASLEAKSSGDLKSTALRTRHHDLRVLAGYMHDVGRGLPESTIPTVDVYGPLGAPPAEDRSPVRLLTAGAQLSPEEARAVLPAYETELADPWGLAPDVRRVDPLELSTTPARLVQRAETAARRQERERARQRFMGRDPKGFEAIFNAWEAQGFKRKRPPAVTRLAELARIRAYKAKARGYLPVGRTDDVHLLTDPQRVECRRAGKAAREGTLKAWARYCIQRGHGQPKRPRPRKNQASP